MARACKDTSERCLSRAPRPSPIPEWYAFGNQVNIRQRFLEEINTIRGRYGLPTLTLNSCLVICAADQNYDRAFNTDNNGDTESAISDLRRRLRRTDYNSKWVSLDCVQGELLARSAEEGGEVASWVVRSLMAKDKYRDIALYEMAKEMGVHGGIGRNGIWYWTQILAAPQDQ